MSHMSRGKRVIVAVMFAVAAIVFLGACDDFEQMAVSDYSDEYSASQSSADQAANASGRTGDREVDGILWVAKTMDDIHQAEGAYKAAKSVEKTEPKRAASLLDDAIKKRPEDIRFRRDRAVIAIKEGEPAVALEQWEEQDRIAASQGMGDQFWYWSSSFQDARNAERNFKASTDDSPISAMDADEKKTYIVIATRLYVTLEKMADLYTMDAQPEMAKTALDAAVQYRDAVKAAGGQ